MNGEVIVKNLLPHLQAWWPAIKMVGIMLGFLMILVGVGSVVSQGRQGLKVKGPVASILAGVFLLNIMSVLNMVSQSVFAQNSETGLSYSAPGGDTPTALYITFAVYIVMLVGISGVIYGGILLKRSAEDGRQLGAAITHLLGGTMAVNIVLFLKLFASSMGPSVASALSLLIG